MTDATQVHGVERERRSTPARRGHWTVLERTLQYARERDYTGWDYSDGTSSRILRALPVDNRWINLAFQEVVKRSPVNVRPLFLVEQRRNYKGAALFTMANLNAHDLLAGRVGDGSRRRSDHGGPTRVGERAADGVDYAAEARSLAEWLVEHRCRGYSGFCGGHRHEVQHLHSKGVPNDPDVVSTTYAVQALLAASRFDPAFAEVARTAADFVVEDLDYRKVDGGAKIDYHMNHPDHVYTLNAGALGARLFVDLYERFGDDRLREQATRILDYLVTKQTDVGGWMYREPADSSHLSMDNHHNGFIVESFQRYRAVVDPDRYQHTLDRALSFYREEMFDDDGAPNFDESDAYPRDIHAAAQGILVFSYAGEFEVAERILAWTLRNLYAGEGRFYYREHRLYTRRITLMRWCQAWMAYAVSEYLGALASDEREPAGPGRGPGSGPEYADVKES
jgi:hypothetical protein